MTEKAKNTISNTKVYLWGEQVGSVVWDSGYIMAFFEYEPNFIMTGLQIAPIKMPLSSQIYSFIDIRKQSQHGLPGLFADSIPDRFGQTLMRKWEEINKLPINSFNPVDELRFIGKRGMGALEYEPALNTGSMEPFPISIEDLVNIANIVVDKNNEKPSKLDKKQLKELHTLIQIGTSAGGARAKAVIGYNPTTGEIRAGHGDVPEGFEHWIIKFDGVNKNSLGDPDGYGRIEAAYHLMVLEAGINMMPSRLHEENGRAHFMTKRFDRLPGNEKVHVQSYNALEHLDHYMAHVYSYDGLFYTILNMRLDHDQSQEMYRRMVFNILARNQDDHTKNVAFIMDKKGNWKLSPAFDMVWQCDPTGKWSSAHQLSANGKNDNFTIKDLEAVAKRFGIYQAKKIRNQVADAVAMWPKFAKMTGVETKFIKALGSTHRLNIVKNIQ